MSRSAADPIAEFKSFLAQNPGAGTDEILDAAGDCFFGNRSVPAPALLTGMIERAYEAGAASAEDPDAFCTITWTRADIAAHLEGCGVEATEGNIDAAIDQIGDTLQDRSTEDGWEAINACIDLDALPDVSPSVLLSTCGKVMAPEELRQLVGDGRKAWADARGIYAAREADGSFTVADNTCGECFVENFKTARGAYAYMRGAAPEEAMRIDRLYSSNAALDGTGKAPLPMERIAFDEEISEVDGLLNFYIPVTFDVDRVFGTDVESLDNDDWLNIYANYDMEHGEVADHLELSLNRADGSIEELTYPLDAGQREALRRKMDAYCAKQTGEGLDGYVRELTGGKHIGHDAMQTPAAGIDLEAEGHDARDVSGAMDAHEPYPALKEGR